MRNMPVKTMTAAALCIAVGGYFFGPVVGAVIGALIDVVGYFVHPTGPFFPGFTISNALIGTIYGLFYGRSGGR